MGEARKIFGEGSFSILLLTPPRKIRLLRSLVFRPSRKGRGICSIYLTNS